MPDVIFIVLSVLISIPVGMIISSASLKMPKPDIVRPESSRRKLVLVVACMALALWAGSAWPGPNAFLGSLLGWQLLILALLDFEHFWLPRTLTITLLVSGLIAIAAQSMQSFYEHALGAAIGFALLAALAFAYRKLRGQDGLGGGDAWLLAGGGAWTGWQGLPTILVLGAGAGLVFVALMSVRGKPVGRAQPIPFGVGLAIGIWLTWLYGPLDGTQILRQATG